MGDKLGRLMRGGNVCAVSAIASELLISIARNSVFFIVLSMLSETSVIYNGAPEEIRTPDPLVRSQVLYPTELRARKLIVYSPWRRERDSNPR